VRKSLHVCHFTPLGNRPRQVAGAVWGTRGPEFKSRRPDREPANSGLFSSSTIEGGLRGHGGDATDARTRVGREPARPQPAGRRPCARKLLVAIDEDPAERTFVRSLKAQAAEPRRVLHRHRTRAALAKDAGARLRACLHLRRARRCRDRRNGLSQVAAHSPALTARLDADEAVPLVQTRRRIRLSDSK
jgi:hypothetical protein